MYKRKRSADCGHWENVLDPGWRHPVQGSSEERGSPNQTFAATANVKSDPIYRRWTKDTGKMHQSFFRRFRLSEPKLQLIVDCKVHV